MMMSDDKVGGWVKKGQNHDDVILGPLHNNPCIKFDHLANFDL